jgi:hypothetical protein
VLNYSVGIKSNNVFFTPRLPRGLRRKTSQSGGLATGSPESTGP